ncbi:putative MFS-type transporter [Cladophialophora carrionii]|uniref:Putative MFS-type transporter n=1 Tax=Cladophialophora carrionii TaxID=86049 RepID=A0A1C1CUX0_9EURO|nr:putative MFS-type transporter [Cladophialophora carrionii]
MEKHEDSPATQSLSLFRLVVDQARVTDEVLNYPYPGAGTVEDPYVVTYIPNDPGNPFTWSERRRWVLSLTVATEMLATAYASSAFSGTLEQLISDLGASTELITAGISLFVLGFAVGPLLWAPLSELYGRQLIFGISFCGFTAFCAGCAGANDIATLLVLRFFAGAFGSSPFTNAGGVIADCFQARERGLAMSIFALAPSMGPTLGPFSAGFLAEAQGWRWVMGLLAIFAGVMWILGTVFVPETYAPVILRKRVAKLATMTGKVYILEADKGKGAPSIKTLLPTALIRPWILLFREPIVLLLSLYIAIIYGTLYLLFGAYPIVFQQVRGWSEGIGGLPFLGVAAGMVLGILFAGWANKWYTDEAARNGGIAPVEARLPPAFYGAVAIPIGLFWFAWTDYPSIHWISPVLAGVPFGYGFTVVFLAVTNYLVDSYTIFAASALAANTVLRSLFGAAFPLFTPDMFDALGIHWATSVPAFAAVACVPFPFIFYKYGARIRSRCVYAAQSEAVMAQLRAKAVASNAQPSETEEKPSRGSTSDDSTDSEKDLEVSQPRFEPIKSRRSFASERGGRASLTRMRSNTGSISEAANYQASPYDIDRVNTSTSVAGLDLTSTATNRSGNR